MSSENVTKRLSSIFVSSFCIFIVIYSFHSLIHSLTNKVERAKVKYFTDK